MRRNPTLPIIRESNSATIAKGKQGLVKGKQGVQSFRKIEDKIHSHDEEIVKNQKIISTLANQFRLLKEQLQFEQQYNEKYKNTMNKYEEETAKHLKVIRDQKQLVARLEHLVKEKDKNIELINKEKTALKQRVDELAEAVEEQVRENKKKDGSIKLLEGQLQRAKKEVKEKETELKQKDLELKKKEAELKETFVSDRQLRESRVKKLEKDLETMNIYLENGKEQLTAKDRQIQRLSVELFQAEEKIKAGDRHEVKAKSLLKEVEMAQKESDELRKRLIQCEDKNRLLQVAMKALESKASANNTNTNTNSNDKIKQIHQEKKELSDRLDKATKEIEQNRKRLQSQKRQREKIEKRELESKERITKLQVFSQKLIKSKGELNQQLSKLKSNILCDFCGKPMKNPVTNIPCGHSYCQQCKVGYLKECKKCSGIKREAVYRNELLDQIIAASSLVERIVLLITS